MTKLMSEARNMMRRTTGKSVKFFYFKYIHHRTLSDIDLLLPQCSCLFNMDHPDVPQDELLVLDGHSMSNVARFVNHRCDDLCLNFQIRLKSSALDLHVTSYTRVG